MASVHPKADVRHRRVFGRQQFGFSLVAAVLTRALGALAARHLTAGHPQVVTHAFDHVGHEININGVYESYELETIIGWLSAQGLVRGAAVDIGANIGNHSLFFAKYFERVHAFEPNSRTFELLSINARLAPNIRCYNFGLSDTDRQAAIVEAQGNFGNVSVLDSEPDHRGPRVMLRTLDGVADVLTDRIGLVKVDVEGHEHQSLSGGRALIERDLPVVLFEQKAADFSGGSSNVVELLRSLGYARFAVVENYPRLSRRIPLWIRTAITVPLRFMLGMGFQVREIDGFREVDYSMLVAIPPSSPR